MLFSKMHSLVHSVFAGTSTRENGTARKADRTPEQAGMKLRHRPVRPEWKPFYAAQGGRIESWARFVKHEPVPALALA